MIIKKLIVATVLGLPLLCVVGVPAILYLASAPNAVTGALRWLGSFAGALVIVGLLGNALWILAVAPKARNGRPGRGSTTEACNLIVRSILGSRSR